ncbi:DNA-binding protein [Kineococcus indalonis]|uniref:DNA-binding protein n=1 Tax=Kineococcus indalonis TaxID=2696566 RepID=UPI0014124467|nr:DNA-binding protein [Kineococcus indalonis]NAZ86228.1 DNA-binding protein [Kineococcus indalonis]
MSPAGRTGDCSPSEGRVRLEQARAFLEVAELVLEESDDGLATPQVAASLAVLCGIAASDAVCCSRLGRRSRGQDHRQAVDLLAGVRPDGPAMAKDLRRLLEIKDQAHYAATMVSAARAEQAVQWARRLYDLAVRTG